MNRRVGWAAVAGGAVVLLLAGIWMSGSSGSSGSSGREEGESSLIETTSMETYRNPMTLEQEWPDYGIGDPFVMRFNGVYYLYCSTKDGRVGVKSWSSTDLVHWKYEGLVTEDPLTTGAYAPEVVYWNGYFYMYTSPAGNGHYVLRSEKPTGPFAVQTENLGLSIDGSVFIDDDGKMVFTHAGSAGIVGHEMSSPTAIDPDGKTLNAYMGHWTEGSMIIKRNGTYYMTYTGNHVFSRGYRINYAVADDSPLGDYRIPDNNPILISTDPDYYGLGHSSTVLGPDLDSYYLVYHNLAGRSAEGPPVRHLNIDRLMFNGEKMTVSGPTPQAQPVPNSPAYSYRPEAGEEAAKWKKEAEGEETRWLSTSSTENRFTAEYNFVASPTGQEPSPSLRMLYSYQDANNYGYVQVDTAAHSIALHQFDAGQDRVLGSSELPPTIDFGKLHTIRLEAANPGIAVYFDGMERIDLPQLQASAGAIGYGFATDASPGIEATFFSNEAGGSSDYEAAKSVPGSIEAVHYMQGEDRGFHVAASDSSTELRTEDGVPIVRENDGSYAVKLASRRDWLTYKLNVAETGSYNVDAMLRTEDGEAEIEIKAGDETRRITLRSEGEGKVEEDWHNQTIATLPLNQGIQTLQIKLLKGKVAFRGYDLYRVEDRPINVPDVLEQASAENMYGDWAFDADGYSAQKQGTDAKLFVGSDGWTDYEIRLDLASSEDEPLYEGSLMFRVASESDYPAQVKDSFIGYELAFRNGRAILKKVNYEKSEELAAANLATPAGQTVSVRVAAQGSRLAVYVGDAEKPLLEWDDPDAYLHGKIGIRSSDPAWKFNRVSLEFPTTD